MSSVTVELVTDKRLQAVFLRLPWHLHGCDSMWVPPLRTTQKEMAGFGQNPFFQEASSQSFVAFRKGEACGRITAIDNPLHRQIHDDPRRGFVGFFESIDDQWVASALFDAAGEWLADRGRDEIRGPVNPSMNYECGLLVDGWQHPPAFMMPYNPPYYVQLWEEHGFAKAQDMFAYWADASMIEDFDTDMALIALGGDLARRFPMRQVDQSRFDEDVRTFLELYNQSCAATWQFVPLTAAEIRDLSRDLRRLIIPDLTIMATLDDRPVAAIFAMLDYNPLIRAINGRLFPFGFAKLLWGRRNLKRARVMSANVLPEFHSSGLGAMLAAKLLQQGLDWGLTEFEFSYVLESNRLSRGTLERSGALRQKTYRLYDWLM